MSPAKYQFRELRRHSAWQRTTVDEFINTVTHGLGFVLAVCGGW